MNYIYMFAFLFFLSCNKKNSKPIFMQSDNKYFKRSEFNFIDTMPDVGYDENMIYYGLFPIKKGFNKQIIRVTIQRNKPFKEFIIDLIIDSTNTLKGYYIERRHEAPKNQLLKEELCIINNKLIEGGIEKLIPIFRNKFSDFGLSTASNYFFSFEISTPFKYECTFFRNPYLYYKNGVKEIKTPMNLVDIIYKNINSKEIKLIIDEAKNEIAIND